MRDHNVHVQCTWYRKRRGRASPVTAPMVRRSRSGAVLRWRQDRGASARLLPRGVDRVETVSALVGLGRGRHVDAVLKDEGPGDQAWPLEGGGLEARVEREEPGDDFVALGLALLFVQLGLALESGRDLIEQPEDFGNGHEGRVHLFSARRRATRSGRTAYVLECGRVPRGAEPGSRVAAMPAVISGGSAMGRRRRIDRNHSLARRATLWSWAGRARRSEIGRASCRERRRDMESGGRVK